MPIEFKIDTANVIIHDHTRLTDWDLPKFRKTIKLAYRDEQNDIEQLREQLLEKLNDELVCIERAQASIKEENEQFERWANDRLTITYCWALDKIKTKHDKQRDKMIAKCDKTKALFDKYKTIIEGGC